MVECGLAGRFVCLNSENRRKIEFGKLLVMTTKNRKMCGDYLDGLVGGWMVGWRAGRSWSLMGSWRYGLVSKFTGNIRRLSVSILAVSAQADNRSNPFAYGRSSQLLPVSTSLWHGCVRIPLLSSGYCYRLLDFFYQPGRRSDLLGDGMLTCYHDTYSRNFKTALQVCLINRQLSFRKIGICK